MAKGAARRFYMTDMDTYQQDKGISYNFYYKNESIIPPLSLVNDTPEQFYLELVRTKIVAEPMVFLMPIDVFRQDVQVNERLANAVYSIIFSKLVNIAERYKMERICRHHKQKQIEYVAKLYDENHHIFANQVLNIHACTYFGYNKYTYSALIKEMHKYRRERKR